METGQALPGPNLKAIKSDLQKKVDESFQQFEAINPDLAPKRTFSYAELYNSADTPDRYLLENFIPAEAVAVFIGEDGIGKTQICNQLALSIAFGYDNFAGLHLQVDECRNSLIVATEDSRLKWIRAMRRQATALEPGHVPEAVTVDFMEASGFDAFEEFKEELSARLKQKKYKVIILDAFSDIFGLFDGDINNSKDARKILSFLQFLCDTHSTTVIVIHHAAKTKLVAKRREGKLYLEKDDAQGAGAITQKPRTVIGLSNDRKSIQADQYTNYLHLLKTNTGNRTYQLNAIELHFNLKTLLHHYKGTVEIEEAEEQAAATLHAPDSSNSKKATPNDIPAAKHHQILNELFPGKRELNRADLVAGLSERYGVGRTKIEQAGGYLTYLLQEKYLDKTLLGFAYRRPFQFNEPPQTLGFADGEEEPF